MRIPEFDQDFFCIANIEEYILAALVSSYIHKPGIYTSLYEFPRVTTSEDSAEIEKIDEHQISRIRAREFSIKVHNVLKRIGGCKFLILAGLSNEQKSYLPYLKEYNVIELQNIDDVEEYLTPLIFKDGDIFVQEKNVLKSLFYACSNNLIIKIDEFSAENNLKIVGEKEGIVIVESHEEVSTVLAINYALSINSDIELINIPTITLEEVENLIESWQDGANNAYNDLCAIIYPSIEFLNLKNYEFATFFTKGIPYSLILKNIIPITHVNMGLNPDFFLFNNIYFERNEQLSSAVIFSPQEFIEEEIDFSISQLEKNNFYVQKLIGKEATANNLDFHLKEFPFDLLHICSHGGEISGCNISQKFYDRDGIEHSIEFDEVVTFSPEPGKELIKCTSKWIFRKFDSFDWRSSKLKSQKFPEYIFVDMLVAIKNRENQIRIRKNVISGSCTIKCYDFNYQAMFNLLAGGQSSIVFNNSCFSWSRISDSFLAVGSRCYIGTLWAIDNDIAKNVAENFYKNLNENSISSVFFKSQKIAIGTNWDNIYLIWGLHFSTLKMGNSIGDSKLGITKKLLRSLSMWKEQFDETTEESVKKNIGELIQWNADLVTMSFKSEAKKIIFDLKKN